MEQNLLRDKLTTAQNAAAVRDAQRDTREQLERQKWAREQQDALERVKALEEELSGRTRQRDTLQTEVTALQEQCQKLELERGAGAGGAGAAGQGAAGAPDETEVAAQVAAVALLEQNKAEIAELKGTNELLSKQKESLELRLELLQKRVDTMGTAPSGNGEAATATSDMAAIRRENEVLLEKVTQLEDALAAARLSAQAPLTALRKSQGQGAGAGAAPEAVGSAGASTESPSLPPLNRNAPSPLPAGSAGSIALIDRNLRDLKTASEVAASTDSLLGQVGPSFNRTKEELQRLADERLIELEAQRDKHGLTLRDRDTRIAALENELAQARLKLEQSRTDLGTANRSHEDALGKTPLPAVRFSAPFPH